MDVIEVEDSGRFARANASLWVVETIMSHGHANALWKANPRY